VDYSERLVNKCVPTAFGGNEGLCKGCSEKVTEVTRSTGTVTMAGCAKLL
jgi:hypothetical protein